MSPPDRGGRRVGGRPIGIGRRRVLGGGLLLAGAATARAAGTPSTTGPADSPQSPGAADAPDLAPSMREPGAPFTAYGVPAPTERAVQRRIGANHDVPGNGIAWTPLEDLEGTITPSGLHFERHHNGVPRIDPATHRLYLHGLVERPLSFDVAALLRYPMVSRTVFIECGGNSNSGWHAEPVPRPVGSIHGLVSCSEWTGVPVSLLLDEAGVRRGAGWVVAEGADAVSMNLSLPLSKLMDDCIVALFQNGERVRPEQGYPLRLVVPGWEGVVNVKWLRRLQVTDRPVMARNETADYTELMPNGRARQFTFRMGVKSLITTPTHGQLVPSGVNQISGLAWSGSGAVARVEVSVDGGEHWSDATLQGPVLAHCLTRFRTAWTWHPGRPALLMSRATDTAGQVQPTRAALVAERGTHGYFHYNAIVCWAVDEDGAVSHAYA